MALTMHYGPVTPDDEDALGQILAGAFGFDASNARAWFAAAGRQEIRSVREDTGFADPWTVAAVDRLSASASDLETLAAAFAGPLPWMQEMF